MTTIVQIPVEVSVEANARIAELGMQREVEAMIEHTWQTVPGLTAISIDEYYDFEEPGPPRVLLTGWREGDGVEPDAYAPEWLWGSWAVRNFPPEVMRWLGFALRYRGTSTNLPGVTS